MHKAGASIPDIAAQLGVKAETIRRDFGKLKIPLPETRMQGDYDKALNAFRQYCLSKRVSQDLISNTSDATPETVAHRDACIWAIHQASGAKAALLSRVTGLKGPTCEAALKRVMIRKGLR